MSYLSLYEEAFDKCTKYIAHLVKEAIDKTEKELGSPFSEDTKKVCVGFAIIYLLEKFGNK